MLIMTAIDRLLFRNRHIMPLDTARPRRKKIFLSRLPVYVLVIAMWALDDFRFMFYENCLLNLMGMLGAIATSRQSESICKLMLRLRYTLHMSPLGLT